MAIADSGKAKGTIAPQFGVNRGSLRLVLGSMGLRSFLYCSIVPCLGGIFLAIGDRPNIGANSGTEKYIGGESDNSFQ